MKNKDLAAAREVLLEMDKLVAGLRAQLETQPTPAMIKAGALALTLYIDDRESSSFFLRAAEDTFRAMMDARDAAPDDRG